VPPRALDHHKTK